MMTFKDTQFFPDTSARMSRNKRPQRTRPCELLTIVFSNPTTGVFSQVCSSALHAGAISLIMASSIRSLVEYLLWCNPATAYFGAVLHIAIRLNKQPNLEGMSIFTAPLCQQVSVESRREANFWDTVLKTVT